MKTTRLGRSEPPHERSERDADIEFAMRRPPRRRGTRGPWRAPRGTESPAAGSTEASLNRVKERQNRIPGQGPRELLAAIHPRRVDLGVEPGRDLAVSGQEPEEGAEVTHHMLEGRSFYTGDNVSGECRRRSPRTRHGNHVGRWPGVPADAWCGEWRKR